MPNRPSVPKDVQRQLWAESMGRCMNPDCNTDLFVSDTSIGEMAHIKPHECGGNVAPNNLIILCSNCHTAVDKTRNTSTETNLSDWKENRIKDIDSYFSEAITNFDEFAARASPLLKRNLDIFHFYGPSNEKNDGPGRRNFWLKFEPEIISNNEKLKSLLTKNIDLLHYENREIVTQFVNHVEEFKVSRDFPNDIRYALFPIELNSIFGIEQTAFRPPTSVSALQKLVDHFASTDQLTRIIHGTA